MSELPVPPTGTVHWVGTGLSTGRTGLDLLGQGAEVVLWGRTRERAAARLDALAPRARVQVRGLGRDDLAGTLRPGDVLVSMLPAAHHPGLLRTAIDAGAHFACTSYTTPEIEELAREAAERRLVVLTEAGLDPGIDHLMTHLLVARARETVGDHAERVSLTSYCGGIPAEPNEFRYQFSWAPLGVLTALASPARYVRDGQVREVERPWEDTEELVLDGEAFEVYPNRDSVGFIDQYGFPEGWRTDAFVRGTLRPQGWRAAWKSVFDTVASGDRERLAALADELAERHPTTAADRDRVVLTVGLDVEGGGRHWSGRYRLDVTGDDTDTAMARCVSTTAAAGIRRVLAAALPPGLHRAAAATEDASRWLDQLAATGLTCTFQSTSPPAPDPAKAS
ncbi:saccharopine dehydrogenase [Streptomyces sp. WAC 01529]|uniref:saccharopine dehydrogenase C-terminal domain-containing protein n=1 Tax=Streptomyces sp. WAC 01529 TaxID=2203205 RepID=UPI000F6CB3DA|nr:saccharopine dehydrogenase C-terminal domain-containing protein [Streptomyces sp. WAC 01529]AZM55269.1 saccharopine dehydrogenase [Streptomyces sp. WAC 01529]